METEILKMVASQGVYAALFVYLLFYVLKENSKREEKYQKINSKREERYQDIISELSSKLTIVEDVKEDVTKIKDKIFQGGN